MSVCDCLVSGEWVCVHRRGVCSGVCVCVCVCALGVRAMYTPHLPDQRHPVALNSVACMHPTGMHSSMKCVGQTKKFSDIV